MWHTTNVLLFKFRCNIHIGVRIIKEMLGSVVSGTHCINTLFSTLASYSSCSLYSIFSPLVLQCWPLFLCLVLLISQINILLQLFQQRTQNRSHTKKVTSKLKNSSLEAVNQRSQLMFVFCWRISQQFFAPSHQLGPKYHLVLVDHTLWWTKIITICISMLQSRKNSCSPRKKATPHRQFTVSTKDSHWILWKSMEPFIT